MGLKPSNWVAKGVAFVDHGFILFYFVFFFRKINLQPHCCEVEDLLDTTVYFYISLFFPPQ